MRFVDVNPFFFPYKGGIERRMDDLAKRLAERGHEVTILTARLPGTAEEEVAESGYRIVRVKSRFLNVYNPPYVSSSGVLEALKSLDADVVNYNYRWAPSWNKDLARYRGPKLFTVHNMWNEGIGLQAKASSINDRRFMKNVLPSFGHIVCVSRHVQDATAGPIRSRRGFHVRRQDIISGISCWRPCTVLPIPGRMQSRLSSSWHRSVLHRTGSWLRQVLLSMRASSLRSTSR